MFNLEEPYAFTSLSYSNMDLNSNVTTYFIRWVDEHGEHVTKVDKKFAEKWNGYAILFEFSNNEVLVLR